MRRTYRLILVALAALSLSTRDVAAASSRSLTLDERVAAQRAIEEVYWRHRIWPKDNPDPKPSLDAVMPESAIRAKVEDYLLKSDALEKVWGRPIKIAELQAEIDRMATHTRSGEVLREIFDGLGNDPVVIAETLARQSLADRLVRSWYARDRRFHDPIRRRVKSELATHNAIADLRAAGVSYAENVWRLSTDQSRAAAASENRVRILGRDDWAALQRQLRAEFVKTGSSRDDLLQRQSPAPLPIGTLGALRETDDSFTATAILRLSSHEVSTATLSWPKVAFDTWWGSRRADFSPVHPPARGVFSITKPLDTACTEDTWSAMESASADPRDRHTAVWTGTEMIVWGGYSGDYLSTGGLYNPATDTWTATPTGPDTPSARQSHSAVWTGTEMIVWGGRDRLGELSTGGRFDPIANSWRPTTVVNAPEQRTGASIFWTGTKVLVWGGGGCLHGCQPLNTGGLYDPASDTWTSTNASATAPFKRYSYSAVWTGNEMIVWGGNNGSPSVPFQSGARYNPASDSWAPTSIGGNVPAPRYEHTAAWTGSEMIVWGGSVQGSYFVTGGRYNPTTDSWAPTSVGANVPSARLDETSVWDGQTMIVWGGYSPATSYTDTGARYDPTADTWTPISTGPTAPSPRGRHTAVWTGDEMIVWGGSDGVSAGTGARYAPDTDTWVPTGMGAAPAAREDHSAVWTGSEMIVWGGAGPSTALNSGGLYNPSTDAWSPTSLGPEVPVARSAQTAVWTGMEMIVWGGAVDGSCVNSGGRYSPVANRWTATNSSASTPSARRLHTSVWTGHEMIVWGGTADAYNYGSVLRTGGRYDPYTDTWTPTNVGPTAPSARGLHTAVFTNGRMIVWGGSPDGYYTNSGGRYDPTTNTWTPTNVASGVPQGRFSHTAVVADGKMIVWGGVTGGGPNIGGVYDPEADAWTPTSTSVNVPLQRSDHAAVWTGTDMIVWGGIESSGPNLLNSGGRHRLATNSWAPTSIGLNVPTPRRYHTAVWTGKEMIIWGGSPTTATGGRYCACPSGRLVYRDADADGYGDTGVAVSSCEGSIPTGYVAEGLDCNDASPNVHPNAFEVCNGFDDDCDGLVDESASGEDVDGDLVHDLCDNCRFAFNTTQSDFDHDGQGDACDLNDGLIYEWRNDKTSVSWQAEAGPTSFNVYVGDLAVLRATGMYTQLPGANALATRQCGVITTSTDDLVVPTAGEVSFSLVSGLTNGIEGSLGSATSGPRTNANPCP